MTITSASTRAGATVAWRRVAVFYGIAFGGACLLGAIMWALGARLDSAHASFPVQMLVAMCYMPLPMIAGLVVERTARRRSLLRAELGRLTTLLGRTVLVAVAFTTAIYAAGLLASFVFGNLARLPGAGWMVTDKAGLAANLAAVLGAVPSDANLPSPLLIYPTALISALGAGMTINGLFAYGEEYGWRGVLADELAPLGALRANLLIGVLWGLWHAPLILLGFDYGEHRFAGIAVMIALTIPLGFVLAAARARNGTVAAPAIIHGAFNATVGVFVLGIAERNPLVAAPTGVVEAVALTVVAVAVWRLGRRPS